MNILITSTARRIDFVNFFKDAFKEIGIDGKIIVADPEHNAPSLQAGDESYVIPHQTDPKYMDAIYEICKKHSVQCLVPLNDWEVPKLSEHKEELEQLGVSVFTPNADLVDQVRDKGKYRELLKPFDVNAPRSYISLNDAEQGLKNNEVSFPLIVKPRNGSASMGVEIAHDIEELRFAHQHAVQLIKESPLDDATYKKPEENIIIQDVIEGEKFSLDIFNDLDGNFLTSFIRKQLDMRGGDVDRCITVNTPELLDIAQKMGENLGHIGYMNADVYYDGSDYYVIDINPRFGGGYAFSHIAGANIPAAIIALTDDGKVKNSWLTQRDGVELARHDVVVQIDELEEQNIF